MGGNGHPGQGSSLEFACYSRDVMPQKCFLSLSALLKGSVLKVTRPESSGARQLWKGRVECTWLPSLLCLPPLPVCPRDLRAPQEHPGNYPLTAFPQGRRALLHSRDVGSNRRRNEGVPAPNCSPGGSEWRWGTLLPPEWGAAMGGGVSPSEGGVRALLGQAQPHAGNTPL